jgi:type I restriction enzyme M protein
MARIRKSKFSEAPLTTVQQLGSIIKSCRDIMRKDKGLSGDLDRLPMLVWVMFLKFIDDMELIREQEAILKGERFRPAIEAPYRWRDWAAKEDGITGDALIAFINQDRAVRPDEKEDQGLFAYLRGLQGANGGDRRDVIATIFRGTVNRMISGYLLRDLINKINAIHFGSSEEIHTLSHLYESMLKEMRDAAGDSGEFYTPRPVIRFMVAVTDPKLGETFLDPACGTGGFLVEAYTHLHKQCKTVQDGEVLQKHSLQGGEAKPLPYMLCQMNLLLHGMEFPQIDPENSLRFPLREIGEAQRVDVILTNPPFGGEEERGILGNFPEDRQTSETALLFLQLIMRKLHRSCARASGRGRAERHSIRRWRGSEDQGGASEGVQPSYCYQAAQRSLRALYQHSHQPALLRPLRADEGGLVLRAAAAGGPQELYQNQASAVRGVRRLPGLVERPEGRREGLEGSG